MEKERYHQQVKKAVKELFESLFPDKCALCRTALEKEEQGICRHCFESREIILDNFCRKCGKKLEDDRTKCYDCGRTQHEFERGHCLFEYEEIKEAILAIKYHRDRWRAVAFAKLMAWVYEEVVREWAIEAVAFVPQAVGDIGQKGYNPPETVARYLCRSWDLPLLKGILKAHRKRYRQKELGAWDRKDNLKNIFYCKQAIPYRRILLIDDVYTTGATMDACSVLLKENGAEAVYFLTIAGGGYRK